MKIRSWKDINKLFDYIDWYDIFNSFELNCIIHDFFKEHNDNVSYEELVIFDWLSNLWLKTRNKKLDCDWIDIL